MGKKSKVAIVTSRDSFPAVTMTEAITQFLRSNGYDSEEFYYEGVAIPEKRFWDRRTREVSSQEQIMNKIERRINQEGYIAVLSIENGDIILRDLNCLKIFFMHTPAAHETYFALSAGHSYARGLTLDNIWELQEKELKILESSDVVAVSWKTFEDYVRKYIYNGKNIVSNPHGGWWGCCPKEKTVSYRFPTSIVYLGALERYFTNMELLSRLTEACTNIIDVYGTPQPNVKYQLRYRGVAPSTDVLYKYQFGLNTLSNEVLRRYAFSSKILCYLSYGLPCLFPEWQLFPHQLGGCVPYNKDNFIDVLESCSEKDVWSKLSREATEQAKKIEWSVVLRPLLKLLDEQ